MTTYHRAHPLRPHQSPMLSTVSGPESLRVLVGSGGAVWHRQFASGCCYLPTRTMSYQGWLLHVLSRPAVKCNGASVNRCAGVCTGSLGAMWSWPAPVVGRKGTLRSHSFLGRIRKTYRAKTTEGQGTGSTLIIWLPSRAYSCSPVSAILGQRYSTVGHSTLNLASGCPRWFGTGTGSRRSICYK